MRLALLAIALASLALPARAAARERATLRPDALPALARMDSLLVAGRPSEARALAESLLALESSRSRRARERRFALLDTLTAEFAQRTYPTLALDYGDRLVSLGEELFDPEGADMARLLLRVSRLRFVAWDKPGGLRDGLRALDLARRQPSIPRTELADFHEEVAVWNMRPGAYDSTRALLDRCLAIRREAFGPVSYEVGRTHGLIANSARIAGEYAEALEEIEKCVTILEAVLPANDPRSLRFYNIHGAILGALRDDERSLEMFRKCVRIATAAFGPYHLDVARFLNNVGLNEAALGRYEAAKACHDSALAIRRRIGDEGGVSESLKNLAVLAIRMGDDAGAEPVLVENLARNVVDGPGTAAEIAAVLSELRLRAGRLDAADSSLALELDLWSRLGRGSHPMAIETRFRRAQWLRERGDSLGAFHAALETYALERSHLELTARTLSERQVLEYEDTRPPALDLALSLEPWRLPAAECARLWDAIIRGRGLVLEEMARRRRAVAMAREDSAVRVPFEELSQAQQSLGALLTQLGNRTPASDSLEAYWRARVERFESQVARASLRFRDDQRIQKAGFEAVREALADGTALVALIGYRELPRVAVGSDPDASGRYAALVLSSRHDVPAIVPLGPSAPIDSLVVAWREAVSQPARDAREENRLEQDGWRIGERLRRTVWDPVAARLEGARLVLLVADGALNLVNFAALPARPGRYLIETGPLVHVLNTERELLRARERPRESGALLVVAAPDFDHRPAAPVAAAADAGGPLARHETLRGLPPDCSEQEIATFDPLPAAELEGSDVVTLWSSARAEVPARFLRGASAAESEFKRLVPASGVVHLATHGFFLDGRCNSPGDSAPVGRRAPPLRLAGLALAGANQRSGRERGGEDGILTAEEIALLDLRSARWVVLSACNSGVGHVRAREGVFGLRRAFTIAGAGTAIMSLWPVEDWSARQWMHELYSSWLKDGVSTAEAIRNANLAVLRRLRSRGAAARPSAWAAFIGSGDWR